MTFAKPKASRHPIKGLERGDHDNYLYCTARLTHGSNYKRSGDKIYILNTDLDDRWICFDCYDKKYPEKFIEADTSDLDSFPITITSGEMLLTEEQKKDIESYVSKQANNKKKNTMNLYRWFLLLEGAKDANPEILVGPEYSLAKDEEALKVLAFRRDELKDKDFSRVKFVCSEITHVRGKE